MSANEWVHLVGIGGAGLSAIATVLLQQGYAVSGSDLQLSPATQRLADWGATIYQGHRAENLPPATTAVVVSSAVAPDSPEVTEARRRGVPVYKRAEWLARMMSDPNCRGVAFAGTHGKTTSTSMMTEIATAAGLDPTFIIGGNDRRLGANAAAGRGTLFVIEADEYDRTFLGLRPEVAVLTVVEWDHPDCYPDFESMRQAFRQFLGKVPASGLVVACGDDPGVRQVLGEVEAAGVLKARVQTYGLAAENLWRAVNVKANSRGGYDFQVRGPDDEICADISLQVPGIHNVKNALGTFASAQWLSIQPPIIASALSAFEGVERRFQLKGEAQGVLVYDDYAHHPTEIKAVLRAAKERYPDRTLWAVFQPHTFSRTRALLDDFAGSFGDADHVIVVDIFASRETPDGTLTSDHLVDRMLHPDARYLATFGETVDFLVQHLAPGAVLLTLGAGDDYRIGEMVLERLAAPEQRVAARPAVATELGDATETEALARQLAGLDDITLLRQEPMSKHTTWGVGGPADLWVTATSIQSLVACVDTAYRLGVPVFVLGSGSNLLVSDRGIRGLVIQNRCRQVSIDDQQARATVESGVNLMSLARLASERGLAGLEWAAGVPGTVGGAVVNNAGAHGACLSEVLLAADVLEPDGEREWHDVGWFDYSYRCSRLKLMPVAGPRFLVLQARLQLRHDVQHNIDERIAEYVRRRQTTQPDGPSAGSVFKNPPGERAGHLLDAAGCKGKRVGAAQISDQHANFLINRGNASAADILALINVARECVKGKFGIELETEIQMVGDWS